MTDQSDSTGAADDRLLAERLAHARERALVDELADLSVRVRGAEGRAVRAERAVRQLGDRLDRLEARQRQQYTRRRGDVAARRLDRQLAAGARRAVRAVRSVPRRIRRWRRPHVAVVCPVYPGGPRSYGGEFIRARVRLYREAGVTVTVIVVPAADGVTRERYQHEDVNVFRVDGRRLAATLRSKQPDVVAVHHLLPHVWDAVQPVLDDFRFVAWVHGFEARDWRELEFNYTPEQRAEQRDTLDAVTAERRATLAAAFPDDRIRFVFVSRFIRGVAERFAGTEAANGQVIPNVIDEEQFRYREKVAADRRRVLWVRSFSAANYANDLARDAVLELANREGFDQLHVTIVGDGLQFDEVVSPLRGLPNVHVYRGFVNTARLRELHAEHGVVLVPTRWDSQGLTCGEAMSSGLVPVTNRVAAIPEFVADDAGMLCPSEDPVALADAIQRLQHDPELYLRTSKRASRTIQERCGRAATIARELELLDTRRIRLRPLLPG